MNVGTPVLIQPLQVVLENFRRRGAECHTFFGKKFHVRFVKISRKGQNGILVKNFKFLAENNYRWGWYALKVFLGRMKVDPNQTLTEKYTHTYLCFTREGIM